MVEKLKKGSFESKEDVFQNVNLPEIGQLFLRCRLNRSPHTLNQIVGIQEQEEYVK